jgi:acyl-CoA dehydrogenase
VIEELREEARALGKRVARELAELEEEEAARAALSALAGAELLAWTVPAANGGAETDGLCAREQVSVRALCAARDELAYHSGMLDVMFVMQGLGSYALALGGTDELKGEVLPGVASGESIAAFALTEPGAGSSLADVETRAERRADGWVLNGR